MYDLLSVKPESPEAKVVQALSVFFLCTLAVGLPTIYSIVWAAHRLGALEFASAVSAPHVSAVAAIVSAAVAVLNYRRSTPQAPAEEKRIIVP